VPAASGGPCPAGPSARSNRTVDAVRCGTVRTEPWVGPAERPRPVAAGTTTRVDLLALGLLVVIAGIVGVVAAVVVDARPMSPDDGLYASLSARWLAGHPLQTMAGDPATIRAPGYVMVLAVATRLLGDWVHATRVIAAPAAALVVLAAGLVARSIGGSVTAVLLAALLATPSVVVGLEGSGIDSLQVGIVLVAIAIGLRAAPEWRPSTAIAAGALLGLSILVKETSLVLLAWPALASIGQPSQELRAAIRWAGWMTLTAAVVVAPWWIWVFAETGNWFPTRLSGTAAALGVAAFGVVAVVAWLGTRGRVAGGLARGLDRLRSRWRWALALLAALFLAALVVAAFTLSQARFSLDRRPSLTELAASATGIVQLFPGPILAVLVVLGLVLLACVVAAEERPALRSVLLALVLVSSSSAIVVLMGWEARSAIASVVLALVIATTAVVRIVASVARRGRARLAMPIRAAAILVPALVVAIGLRNAWTTYLHEPNRTIRGWGSPQVANAARWIDQHAAPGETIVTSWLFGWSLDADTSARYRWVLQPTLQLRIGKAGEPPFVPVGTLFREPVPVPRTTTGDYLFVRYHDTEHYYVGLEATALAHELAQPGVGHLVVAGESQQSSAGITAALDGWPGLHREVQFDDGPRHTIIYSVDPATVRVGPSVLQMNGATARYLIGDVARVRSDVTPGAYLRTLLGDRPLAIFPTDAVGERRAREVLAQP
jgi:dolichyl-phosphate-mannose-protein mannosyltransferase